MLSLLQRQSSWKIWKSYDFCSPTLSAFADDTDKAGRSPSMRTRLCLSASVVHRG